MAGYVKGVVSGRLTKDVEVAKTGNGNSVCSFSIAVDRRQSEGQESTADFFNCVAWKGTADFLSSYAHKGDTVTAEYRLQTRTYKNKQGMDVHVTELVLDNIIAITPKRGQSQPNQTYGQQPVTSAPATAPAPQPTMQPAQQTPYPAQAQPVPAQPQQQYQGYPEPDFSGEDFGL